MMNMPTRFGLRGQTSLRPCADPRSYRRGRVTSSALGVVAITLAFLLGACQLDPNFGPIAPYAPPPLPYTVASYLEAGDKLKIMVYGEEALSGVYDISPDGTLTMPLVGALKAAGQTRGQVERTITTAYSNGNYLREPKVSVADVTYRPIYVIGEVQTPGKYVYAIGLDVLTAIATAGGFSYRASRSDVLIRHYGDNAWQKYSLAAPLPVAPGDLIRVPERYF